MSTNATPSSPHPIVWIAGIAVTLLSAVGIAAMTGWLPKHDPKPADPPAVVATTAAADPAAPAAAPTANVPPQPAAAAEKAEAPVPHPAPRHVSKPKARATLPPPEGAGVPPDYVPPPAAKAAPACTECGVIANIRQVTHEGQGSGLGAVGGALVGGAVANNIGQGSGRTLATIAGMVGGGLLGNKIEKHQRQTVSYQVSVRMEDGTSSLVSYENAPPWRVGDAVKVVNGTLVAR